LEFWATLDVIGARRVCVRRIAASEVRQVEREDGAIWSPGCAISVDDPASGGTAIVHQKNAMR
jgi:hypothetical protein